MQLPLAHTTPQLPQFEGSDSKLGQGSPASQMPLSMQYGVKSDRWQERLQCQPEPQSASFAQWNLP